MIHDTPDVAKGSPAIVSGVLQKPPTRKSSREVTPVSVTAARLVGEDRRRMIAEAAYYRAEQRGFVPGQELEDWLAAEMEIDALMDDEVR
jgi:hypothetical protein